MTVVSPSGLNLARQVRSWRLARGLRQVDLAQRAGVSQSAVSGIESGRNDTTVSVALALSHALGVTVDQLLHEVPPT